MSSRIVSVEVRGLREATESLRKMGADVSEGVRQTLNATGLEVLTTVRNAIQRGPKTGTTYFRIPGAKYMTVRAGAEDGPPVAFIPGGGKANLSLTHQASAPGEAPASDTGTLASSIYYTSVDEYTVAIGSRLEYAFYLEFGTRKIKKRPSWVPAAEKAAPRLQKRLERLIREATARAQKGTA